MIGWRPCLPMAAAAGHTTGWSHEREIGNGSMMTASNPAVDQAAATSHPPATPPAAPAPWPAARPVATWAVIDPLTDRTYSRWRRERYSWLYEDEDIWAAP